MIMARPPRARCSSILCFRNILRGGRATCRPVLHAWLPYAAARLSSWPLLSGDKCRLQGPAARCIVCTSVLVEQQSACTGPSAGHAPFMSMPMSRDTADSGVMRVQGLLQLRWQGGTCMLRPLPSRSTAPPSPSREPPLPSCPTACFHRPQPCFRFAQRCSLQHHGGHLPRQLRQ